MTTGHNQGECMTEKENATVRTHKTSLEGYVRMGCPQCITEVNYPEDNGMVPICPKCDVRMQKFPIEHTKTPEKDNDRND